MVKDDQGQSAVDSWKLHLFGRVEKDRQVHGEAQTWCLQQYRHTYAKTLQTNVQVHNYNAKVRKFSSAREAALLLTSECL